MRSSYSAKMVRFEGDNMWVDLADGRTLVIPLAWFPRLLRSTPEQRERLRISSRGIHWDELDEDISVSALAAGFGDQRSANKPFLGAVAISHLSGWPTSVTVYDRCPSVAVYRYDRMDWLIEPESGMPRHASHLGCAMSTQPGAQSLGAAKAPLAVRCVEVAGS
jgi:hypothetical protein